MQMSRSEPEIITKKEALFGQEQFQTTEQSHEKHYCIFDQCIAAIHSGNQM